MQVSVAEKNNSMLVYQGLLFAPLFLALLSSLGIFATGAWIVILFAWAFSTKPFLKAHARQGLLICFLGVYLLGLINLFDNIASTITPLAILAWIVLNVAGIRQAKRGRSWIGKMRVEILQNPMARPQAARESPQVSGGPADSGTIEYYLNAFRSGDAAERQAAVQKLEELGQVETF